MNIKLIDFGLSNVFTPSQTLKTFCGSPTYAAPELVQRHEYTGPEVDCWSLGVLLYVFVCGELPFDGNSFNELYTHIIRAEYIMPPYLSPACQDLIRHMLVPNPARRYTIAQIVSHPWVVSGGYKPPNLRTITPKMGFSAQTPIDMEVLSKMESLGFEKSAVLRSLFNDSYDDAAATYYLLCSSLKDVRSRKSSVGKASPPPVPGLSLSQNTKSPSPQANSPVSPRGSNASNGTNGVYVPPIVITKHSDAPNAQSTSQRPPNVPKLSQISPRKEKKSKENPDESSVDDNQNSSASLSVKRKESKTSSSSSSSSSPSNSVSKHRSRAASKESRKAANVNIVTVESEKSDCNDSVAPSISLTTSSSSSTVTSSKSPKSPTATTVVNPSSPATSSLPESATSSSSSSSSSSSKKKTEKLSRFYTLRHSKHSKQKEDETAASIVATPRKTSISSAETSNGKVGENDKKSTLRPVASSSTSSSSSSSKHKHHTTLRGTSSTSSSKSPSVDEQPPPDDVDFDVTVSDVKVTVAQEKYEGKDSGKHKALSLRSKIKKESVEASEPRSKRFPFSMEMTTTKQPKDLIEEIKHILGTWEPPIVFNIVTPFFLVCEAYNGALTFEIEVCKVSHLSLNGIRLHKIKGDSWEYKNICKSIMNKLDLKKK